MMWQGKPWVTPSKTQEDTGEFEYKGKTYYIDYCGNCSCTICVNETEDEEVKIYHKETFVHNNPTKVVDAVVKRIDEAPIN